MAAYDVIMKKITSSVHFDILIIENFAIYILSTMNDSKDTNVLKSLSHL